MWTSPVNFRFPFIWKCSHSIEVWRISLSIDSINLRSWTHRSVSSMVGPSFVLRVNSFRSLFNLKESLSRVDSTNDTIYRYFLDNRRTVNHQSLIFGLRELNWNETLQYCFNSSLSTAQSPITSEGIHFTADYELRIYTAGCYYVDANHKWKSDGLTVRIRGSLRHQCLVVLRFRLDQWPIMRRRNVSPLIWLPLRVVSSFYQSRSTGAMCLPMLISWRIRRCIWQSSPCLLFTSLSWSLVATRIRKIPRK